MRLGACPQFFYKKNQSFPIYLLDYNFIGSKTNYSFLASNNSSKWMPSLLYTDDVFIHVSVLYQVGS